MDFVIDLIMRADLVDILDRAFADEHVVALVIDDHRHALALEIEGDLIHLAAAALHVELGMREHRAVQQVAQPGLVVTVHVGVAQHVLAIPVGDIHGFFQNDAVLGQRAGLVRAKNVDGAEVLDRVEALDDHLLLRHRDGPL